ncbi:Uncharacterized conserved protein, DUF1330 family [Williamsia sterculiae]|uniref:Uncharacterized conserved protein, DUF1330 family n=1 Tax=Williamsia sterculiae TaxID=1344003 RepID=A0A1N7FWX2_9NOCA|nr:Uncharacterized conserved protein, DUF1330 family [Williamsia sterculiae]
MTAYAIAHMHNIHPGEGVGEYLGAIDATLAPFSGRFIVHGGRQRVVEGPVDGIVVVIEFPDFATVQRWYESSAYQDIVGLRAANTCSVAVLAERCASDHRATDVLAEPDHYR